MSSLYSAKSNRYFLAVRFCDFRNCIFEKGFAKRYRSKGNPENKKESRQCHEYSSSYIVFRVILFIAYRRDVPDILSCRYISRYLDIYAGAFPDNLTFNQWHARREKVFPTRSSLHDLSKAERESPLGEIKIFRYETTVTWRGPSSFASAINANEKRRFFFLFLFFFFYRPRH